MKLPANVWKMYVFKFLTSLHFFAGVLIPFFTDWGGITFTQVMLLQSWFVLCSFLLEVPTGAVADWLGRRASLLLGAGCLAAAAVVYASRPAFSTFFAAETLWAAAAAFVSGADEAIVYDTLKHNGFERHSKKVLARFASCEIGAIMVAAPLGGLIAEHWGLRAPMLVMTLPFAAAVVVAWTLEEPYRGRPGAGEARRYLRVLLSGMQYFLNNPALRSLAFDSVAVHVLSFMMIWLFQPRLKELGVPIGWFGFVTAAGTATQLVLMSQFERLERLLGGRKRYLLASALIPGVCYLLLAAARHPVAAAAGIVAVTGFGLSRSTLIGNYMQKHIESHHRATVLSSVGMARGIASAFVYPVVGLLAQWSLSGTLVILGSSMLLAAAVSRVTEDHLLD